MNALRRNQAPIRAPRGVAMLLVIICLAMATILATAYLASRDNSGAIGANVVDAAQARWVSESGIELAVAVLETEANWRTEHVNGKLIDDMSVSGGTLDVDLLDYATSKPPTEESDVVLVTSTATTNGISRVSHAIAWIEGVQDVVNLDLSEFAVFSSGPVELSGDATMTRWPMSPMAKSGGRVHVGTRATDAFSFTVKDRAASIDTTVIYGPGASSSLINNASGPAIDAVALDAQMPLPEPPATGVAPPGSSGGGEEEEDGGGSSPQAIVASSATSITTDTRAASVDLDTSAGVLTLDGDVTLISDGNVQLKTSSGILVNGDARLIVFGNLQMASDSYIELASGTSLELFVYGDVQLQDAYVGDTRADKTARDSTGYASWMDPKRILMYTIPKLAETDPINNANWSLAKNSVVKGSLYGPNAAVNLKDDSAIYGRIASSTLKVENRAGVFYDHTLEERTGFTNRNGGLYESDGTMKNWVGTIASLTDSELLSLAEAQQIAIKAGDETYGTRTSSYVPPPSGTPSERPVEVSVRLVSVGVDTGHWEVKAQPVVSAAATLRQDTTDLSTTISSLDVLLFSGATLLQRLTQQNTLSASLDSAANQINSGDYAAAVTTLQGAYDQVDGDATVTDVMLDGPEKTAAANEINRILTALQAL